MHSSTLVMLPKENLELNKSNRIQMKEIHVSTILFPSHRFRAHQCTVADDVHMYSVT